MENLRSVLLLLLALFVHRAFGCATELKKAKVGSTAWSGYLTSHVSAKSRTPAADDASGSTAWSTALQWGGNDPANWKPEAVVANAASESLAVGYARPGVREVLVSIPVKMLYGPLRPYGDGQTNASIRLGSFTGKIPPVVASWIRFLDGTTILNVRVNHVDGILTEQAVTLDFADGAKPVSLGPLRAVRPGIYEISWSATNWRWGDLYENHVAYLSLPGVKDPFPIDFRDTAKPAAELLAAVAPRFQNLSKGTLLDPERVGHPSGAAASAFAMMYPHDPSPSCASGCVAGAGDFGVDVRAVRYSPVIGVHNQYASVDGMTTTAVGNGDTTLILPPVSPFKMAYICFDGRNLAAEKFFGTPSGGGWHEIGDNAETVMNTLENASVLFGYANGRPGDGRRYSYGLSDVALFRRLPPGAALVTAVGPTTAAEGFSEKRGTGPANGRNYHWFAFDQPTEVCAVEWVHPCVPTRINKIGLSCLP